MLEALFDSVVHYPLRAAPATALAITGVLLTGRGIRLGWRWAHHHDAEHNLRFVRGFRLAVIGLALLAIAAAWQWHVLWLLVLAIAVAFEEILESSIHAYAIRRGLRLEAERAAQRCAA